MNKLNLKHEYDVSLNINDSVQNVDRTTYFHDNEEVKEDDGSFDCGGTLGSAGSFGGTLGTFGCFGCCC